MLTSISLENFKSLARLPRLDLSPVTILSGPNSSGKSSLIQALLVLKQTLESPSSEDPIILNGSLVALGDYDDVRSFSAQHGDGISIAVTVHYPADRDTYFSDTSHVERRRPNARSRRQRFRSAGGYIADLTMRFHNAGAHDASKNSRSRIHLQTTQFRFGPENADTTTTSLLVTCDSAAIAGLNRNYRVPRLQATGYNERLYPVQLSGSTLLPSTEIVACALDHFLPYETWGPDPLLTIDNLVGAAYRQAAPDPQGRKGTAISAGILEAVDMIRRARDKAIAPFADESLEQFIDRVLGEKQRVVTLLRTFLHSEDGRLWSARFEDAKKKPPLVPTPLSFSLQLRDSDVSIPALELDPDVTTLYLEAAANDFVGFFTKSVYYLGPLREEPRAFYRRLGSSDPLYVGQRGENAAFVLKYYGTRTVQYVAPPPSNESWDPRDSGSIRKGPLEQAVKEWMHYLDLATDLAIRDVGKIGLSIQASIRGKQHSTDLTNVGVGVSQALPLVVLGLASPPGATLLVEQPELHLHPFVQSRLADFFLSLTAMGKQVIAETHSEHLIHRMRLYVARGTLSPEKDLAIYFFSNSSDSSESRVQHIKIGEYGEIDEWPEGFFDETTKQLDAILKATLDRAEVEEE